ncbi:MAG: type II secretion system protein [Elusimicrobiaceae bacterium]|jgi:prepilin-type N-terminal cleavage/methylation domain-containing protein|nr:type II secretion system protein [Elusimicrobiaceae bacterium]MBT4008184.1 type II secretion system protein [Elusimicrobiaceae bacterium]MBT4402516.1 type II secretion system protein [Elusimicrobiaceae bacterium]MBT4439643.1 type II secretion system protein [Elusimicrobiaceae bacterium]MBT5988063.1 type II secretion system protein [Elusimicrobiaceae bacterium]
MKKLNKNKKICHTELVSVSNKKGFTLIELLVAAVIVGLVVLALMGLWRASFSFMSAGGQETMYQNRTANAKYLIHKDITEATTIDVPPAGSNDDTTFLISGATNVSVKGSEPYDKVVVSNDIDHFFYCIDASSGDILYRYRKSTDTFELITTAVLATCGQEISGWRFDQVLTEVEQDECAVEADSDYNAVRVIIVTEKVFASTGKVVRTEIDERFRVLGSPSF